MSTQQYAHGMHYIMATAVRMCTLLYVAIAIYFS